MTSPTARIRSHGVGQALLGLLAACAVALGAAATLTTPARADGDPGSDVLVYQPLFLAADSGISASDQVRLGNLIHAATKSGFPVRVAIIAKPDDLGAVTALWQKPRSYARFLGIELSLAYKGRLLVVMPNGFGFNWPGHPSGPSYRILGHLKQAGDDAGLAAATQQAISALAAAYGVHLTAGEPSGAKHPPSHARASQPSHAGASRPTDTVPSASTSTRALAFIALALLAAAIVAVRLLYRRNRQAIDEATKRLGGRLVAHRRASLSLTITAAAAIVVAVGLFFTASPSQPSSAAALGENPVLDPGTALARPAHNFTLINQFGRSVSLRSFRGKVVILGFNDSECTTLCPLTTTAMLDAKAMLGSAGSQVQLVGVDANPKATSIGDVLSYSEVHGMTHAWDFLTGSLKQLRAVWHDYSIGVEITHNLVDHNPAIYVISPRGEIAKLFLTQQSYAAIGQLAQLLAGEASDLLPGHPQVHSHLSYAHIPGIPPTRPTSIPRVGGRKLSLGPGKARIMLFFATWDRQITGLAGGLEGLEHYQSLARRDGLPQLTGVDEGSVEPRGALAAFMKSLPPGLNYPVGIDTTGRLADGYEVDGQPWLMEVNSSGNIAFYYSVAALGWPTTAKLAHLARAGLERVPATTGAAALAGSPPALASLHRQASRLIGDYAGLAKRIRALRGYPIVLNVWASWCIPCQAEFGLFAAASERYGRRVAFLGANAADSSSDARAFLHQHPVSYPSYSVATTGQLSPFASIEGLPTTIYINKRGKVVDVHSGQYDSQGVLDSDITTYTSG
jgi:cytochrome oxidase Cu insertion factor (SCO1/SenC/PrrC family)/thiol-disulfide isomerase/thioredoxin